MLKFNFGIQGKIIITTVILVILPLILLGVLAYERAKEGIYYEVETKLAEQVENFTSLAETMMGNATITLESSRGIAKDIITQQAQVVTKLLKHWDGTNMELFKNSMAEIDVGKTGYIAILDYKGTYIVSNDRKSDGINIYGTKDESGNLFIKELVDKGKRLALGEVDYHNYFWKNRGEERAREKIAAILHYPKEKWVIAISAYYDDLVNMDIVSEEIQSFKKLLLSKKVGKTGYLYVMDSEGDLIMHPTHEGKSISKYDFVQTMIKKKVGFIEYDWQGRTKILAFSYYPEKDWIVASGSYIEDFEEPIIKIRNYIIAIAVIALIVATSISIFVANKISAPVLKLVEDIDLGADQVKCASMELSEASCNIARMTTEQSSSFQETSATMEQITAIIQNNTDSVERMTKDIDRMIKMNQDNANTTKKLLEAMRDIGLSNEKILGLSKVIKDIGEKTDIINEIVFQTKLLSFNASVEAERAGEHGRGFAVVAQEVGNLAQLSGGASVEISEIVKSSRTLASQVTDENRANVERGRDLVEEVAKVSEKFGVKYKGLDEGSKKLLTASHEQLSGVDQIREAFSKLDEQVQFSSSVSEETASSSEELSALSGKLREAVSEIKELLKGKKDIDSRIGLSSSTAPKDETEIKELDSDNIEKAVA